MWQKSHLIAMVEWPFCTRYLQGEHSPYHDELTYEFWSLTIKVDMATNHVDLKISTFMHKTVDGFLLEDLFYLSEKSVVIITNWFTG